MSPRALAPLLTSLYRLCEPPGGDLRTDTDLLGCFRRTRDPKAFAALVYRHGSMVLAVCKRLLADEHEAEDAFQATFLVLVRKADSLRQPGPLAPWLHGVAQRVALRLRQKSSRQAPTEDLDPADLREAEPLDRLARREVRAILDEEIERLPSRYRLPVVLCYLQGQSYTEAAHSLGWPAGTVSIRLARARQKLRDAFARRGLGLPAALAAGLLGREALAAPPAGLLASTVESAVGAGGSALSASPQVIALAEGALQAMWMSKVKSILFAVVVAALACTGLGGLACRQRAVAQDTTRSDQPLSSTRPKVAEGGENKDLDRMEAELKTKQAELEAKQRQIARLRQGNSLNEIEAALNKLRQANAGDPNRRAAVEAFAKAFARLKQELAGKTPPRLPGKAPPPGSSSPFGYPGKGKVEMHSYGQVGLPVDGRVLQVDSEKKEALLSGGSKDGFKKGQLFRAYQGGKGSPDQTAWIRVTEVSARWSIGKVLHDFAPRAPVKANDILQLHQGKTPRGIEDKEEE
jgi:RNA polymerase sigma factor (sigma-70 family)